ncbi:TerC family protein [Paraferrimonas sedimenticola]|uniref:Membrane protein n=1 Tax=Paraferrimonas sedimenticola TaxID=375674 RepID=A0AA37RWT6_9GAMM|nr:TerC family protein [Paraferrimonas sedimenticola]GLP96212.1 membrane protein [Paraferrimonas sedimenticola]
MFDWVASPEAWAALASLIALEIVLGIDNIIFISILVGRLPPERRNQARQLGIGLAMLTRLLLLFSLVWVMGLVEPLFSVFDHAISGRDLILIGGGLFLIAKSTHEIHASFDIVEDNQQGASYASFGAVLAQIAVLDIVFSLDSVITAVGLVDHLSIMVIAVVSSVVVMLFAAKPIGQFVDANPTVKMLALAFLLLIGFTLVAEGFEVHVPKGYIYFAMAFSFSVELLNIANRRRRQKRQMRLSKKLTPTSESQELL